MRILTIYIKTHNITGLKYFGVTIKKNVHAYRGSGKYWLNHIKVHGYDVTTTIYAQFNENAIDLIEDVTLDFSYKNNIEKSKCWANLIPETGGTPPILTKERNGMFGKTHTDQVKTYLSQINKNTFVAIDKNGIKYKINTNDARYASGELVAESKGRKYGEDVKENARQKALGSKNPKAKIIQFFNEDGILMYESFGGLIALINKLGLNNTMVYRALNTGSPIYTSSSNIKKENIQYIGWTIKYKKGKDNDANNEDSILR